ncbi:alpha/beta fold hydrolase [Legionella gresilensis]|uniref:alpha/beta fold hydrolase n=1 Tax=Legionella gresilensis TaxID=91823 RepID=UPI0010412BBA|nr:alpha/beta fold hydrolase [Legionella gresilensis]
MPKMKIKNISIYYEVHGFGEPIIFISGFSVDHTVWQEILPYFKDKYKVILIDNRGAGQTDVPQGPYTIAEMADDIVQLCRQLKIKQAHFVGNSMGGLIVQTLAFKQPDLVTSATISNSVMTIHTPYHLYMDAQLDLLKAQVPMHTLIKASASWLFSFQFLAKPGAVEQLIKQGLSNPYPFTLAGYEGQYAALANFDSSAWVSQIKAPTLVLAGDEDLIFNKEAVHNLAKNMLNAEYFCFTHCGHLPYIEYPKLFASEIKSFHAKLD